MLCQYGQGLGNGAALMLVFLSWIWRFLIGAITLGLAVIALYSQTESNNSFSPVDSGFTEQGGSLEYTVKFQNNGPAAANRLLTILRYKISRSDTNQHCVYTNESVWPLAESRATIWSGYSVPAQTPFNGVSQVLYCVVREGLLPGEKFYTSGIVPAGDKSYATKDQVAAQKARQLLEPLKMDGRSFDYRILTYGEFSLFANSRALCESQWAAIERGIQELEPSGEDLLVHALPSCGNIEAPRAAR